MILFARRVTHLTRIEKVWETDVDGGGTAGIRRYCVKGQQFFHSSDDLVYQFDYAGRPGTVIVDLSDAEVWDASTVASLDAVIAKYRDRGEEARIWAWTAPAPSAWNCSWATSAKGTSPDVSPGARLAARVRWR